MENRRFKPLVDKSYYIIWGITVIILAMGTVISCVAPLPLCIMIFTDLITVYFLITSLFGYVELREKSIYVKLGLITDREIAYDSIRGVVKDKKLYSESTVSLKCALEHVNIKYNKFDVLTVSVVGNDELIREVEARIK